MLNSHECDFKKDKAICFQWFYLTSLEAKATITGNETSKNLHHIKIQHKMIAKFGINTKSSLFLGLVQSKAEIK
jgi:hypothetical protein